MTIAEVITLRNILKAGKNLPLQIYLDNAFSSIDESNVLQFTLWDDDNGLLYSFRLPALESDDYGTSNRSENVSVYVATYEQIQGMGIGTLPLAELEGVLDSINETRPISPEMKNLILTTYNKILKENYVYPTPEDYNKITGSNLNTQEDYYKGKTAPNRGKFYPNSYSYYGSKETSENGGAYTPTGIPTIPSGGSGSGGNIDGDAAAALQESINTVSVNVAKANKNIKTVDTKVDNLTTTVEGIADAAAYVDDEEGGDA